MTYTIDPETGEILDVTTPQDGFQVTDRASAEWVLEKMAEAEAAAQAHKARLEAVKANIESQIKDEERKLAFLDFKFGHQLRLFAEQELDGKKSKTLKLDNGKLSLRTVPAKWEWNQDALLPWAKKYAPEAIKTTEKVLVSELTDAQKAVCSTEGIAKVTDSQEVFSVKTGVPGAAKASTGGGSA